MQRSNLEQAIDGTKVEYTPKRERVSSFISVTKPNSNLALYLTPVRDIGMGINGLVRKFSTYSVDESGSRVSIDVAVKSTAASPVIAKKEYDLMRLCYPSDGHVTGVFHFPEPGRHSNRIVMPDYGDVTLKSMIPNLSKGALLALMIEVLQELQRIHPLVIHGDIKEDNVMLVMEGGRHKVKLVDFGHAYLNSPDATVTQGTAPHWAYERQFASGCKPHPSQDVFSIGSMMTRLWELWRSQSLANHQSILPYSSLEMIVLLELATNPDPALRPGLDQFIRELEFQLFCLDLTSESLSLLDTSYANKYIETIFHLFHQGKLDLAWQAIMRNPNKADHWTLPIMLSNIFHIACHHAGAHLGFIKNLFRHFDIMNQLDALLIADDLFGKKPFDYASLPIKAMINLFYYLSSLKNQQSSFFDRNERSLNAAIAVKELVLSVTDQPLANTHRMAIALDPRLSALVRDLVACHLFDASQLVITFGEERALGVSHTLASMVLTK